MRLVLALLFSTLAAAPALADDAEYVHLLRGSPQAQERQNFAADRANFSRLNEQMLAEFKKNGLLVQLAPTKSLQIDKRLPAKYRWIRPHTASYVLGLSKDYYARWGVPLKINSAVRSTEYQRRLAGHNANAAPTTGPKRSSHLTGATVDIAKLKLPDAQVRWLRQRLAEDERKGLVEATEEHFQAVFHVMVFGNTS